MSRFPTRKAVCIASPWLIGAAFTLAGAQEPESSPAVESTKVAETVQVTATRLPEDIMDIAAPVTVIPGADLAARGVHDLSGALALVGGLSIVPGGDGGPASSVPEMMGLREFDAFLLVVDGVPWGGAFNPALATLDLTNVDRIEVLRGAAPVLYGATSFVGVIHVIHRTPPATPHNTGAWGGSYDSFGAGVVTTLPGGAGFHQALSAAYDRQGFRTERTKFDRLHAMWSATVEVGGGLVHLSADLTGLDQDPASPYPRQGAELSPLVPVDANINPSDAEYDENRYHLVGGYDHSAGPGTWTTTLALTHSTGHIVRGFLMEDFDVPPPTPNANGYRQDFTIDGLYLDSHWSWKQGTRLTLVTGLDLLAGKGSASSENFRYHVNLDGSDPPSSESAVIDERPELEDERTFGGAYAQLLWSPGSRWRVDAGLRLNVIEEKLEGEVEVMGQDVMSQDSRSLTRPSGSLGASFRAWRGKSDSLWIYAQYTDAFKPAAIDFGPEAEGEILDPETAQTYRLGTKGSAVEGRLFWQADGFWMDFDNLVVAQTVMGLPSLTNAGEERFKGIDTELRYALHAALTLQASFALHSAKFLDYVAEFDGVPTQLAGNRLEMSPEQLASLGATWSPTHGWQAWATANYVGDRYLNKRNTALADGYTAVSAGFGYRFSTVEIRAALDNIGDVRPPVAESELGDAQYYLLPARSLRAAAIWRF